MRLWLASGRTLPRPAASGPGPMAWEVATHPIQLASAWPISPGMAALVLQVKTWTVATRKLCYVYYFHHQPLLEINRVGSPVSGPDRTERCPDITL